MRQFGECRKHAQCYQFANQTHILRLKSASEVYNFRLSKNVSVLSRVPVTSTLVTIAHMLAPPVIG